jgi:hypothetical protein
MSSSGGIDSRSKFSSGNKDSMSSLGGTDSKAISSGGTDSKLRSLGGTDAAAGGLTARGTRALLGPGVLVLLKGSWGGSPAGFTDGGTAVAE